jgi:hypothetical protein
LVWERNKRKTGKRQRDLLKPIFALFPDMRVILKFKKKKKSFDLSLSR